jgi:hypothetical protein
MTVNELIERLEEARHNLGGEAPVMMVDHCLVTHLYVDEYGCYVSDLRPDQEEPEYGCNVLRPRQ